VDREELLASLARARVLLETSIFAPSSDDDARRLTVDDKYERWVRHWDTMPVGFQKAGRLEADHLKSDDGRPGLCRPAFINVDRSTAGTDRLRHSRGVGIGRR
jgi:hypothetical protein